MLESYTVGKNDYDKGDKMNIKKKLIKLTICSSIAVLLTGCDFFKKQEEEEYEPAVNNTSTIGDINTNTLKLSMNGSITEISCENYNESGVDISGLEKHVRNEIDTYNNDRGASKINLVEYKEDNGVVRTAIQYSDLDTYNEFNHTDIFLSLYSVSEVDKLAKEDADKHRVKEVYVSKIDLDSISEEELAAAGYTLEEIKAKQEAESKPEEATETDATATFTDASGNVSESADITDTSLMMLTTNADVNIIINSGNVLYVNKYADIVNDNTADLKGDGTAVVVYKFNY